MKDATVLNFRPQFRQNERPSGNCEELQEGDQDTRYRFEGREESPHTLPRNQGMLHPLFLQLTVIRVKSVHEMSGAMFALCTWTLPNS